MHCLVRVEASPTLAERAPNDASKTSGGGARFHGLHAKYTRLTTMNPLALLTQHNKACAIGPALEAADFAVFTVDGFDTDSLGTFTGETARRGGQVDAAVVKAQKACELSGERYGLGSEGSFGPDPYAGIAPWAIEVLVWWDAKDKRAVQAMVQGGATHFAQCTVSSWQDAQAFALEVQFPSHGIIVGKPGTPYFSKEILDLPALQRRVTEGLVTGPVWLETDMRAHRNPTRMAMIALCAKRLADLLQRPCPGCAHIGFGHESPLVGALCSQCGLPTLAMRAKRIQCGVCNFSSEEVVQATVSPSRCERCNP